MCVVHRCRTTRRRSDTVPGRGLGSPHGCTGGIARAPRGSSEGGATIKLEFNQWIVWEIGETTVWRKDKTREEFLLNSYIFLGLFVRSWEMKVGKEKSIPKIRRMSGSLPNILNPFAGGSGPLATNIYQDKCCWLLDLHVFHLPAKRRSKSQRCVKPGQWITASQCIRRMNTEQVFHIQHFV